MRLILKAVGSAVLWLIVALLLVIIFVPVFLDRTYYRGAHSDHYDGEHFSNPDGEIHFAMPKGKQRSNRVYRFLLGEDDRPEWPDHVAITPSIPPASVEGMDMRATWVGHATVLVQAGGLNILTDPIWSDHASPFPGIAGPTRVAKPGIAFDDVPKIDIIVVSHNHYDHMDLPTLKRLWERDRPLIVTSLGNDTILDKAGVKAQALDWGDVAEVKGAKVHVIRNHHWSSRWGRDRNRALWSAFVIETQAGNIFFAGDTGMGDGKWPLEARKYGPVRLAIIPIGAFRFYPGQMETDSHIGPEQAVEMFKMLGAAQGIPIHWGTFRLSDEARDTPPKMQQLYMRCGGLAPQLFRPLDIGEAIDVHDAPWPEQIVSDQARADCKAGSAALEALQ